MGKTKKDEKLYSAITKLEEYNKQRERLFKKWDDLDNVIHILQATANTYYSVFDKESRKGWNTLLKKRDELKPFINKEISQIQQLVDEIDNKIKLIRQEIKVI